MGSFWEDKPPGASRSSIVGLNRSDGGSKHTNEVEKDGKNNGVVLEPEENGEGGDSPSTTGFGASADWNSVVGCLE